MLMAHTKHNNDIENDRNPQTMCLLLDYND